MKLKLKKIILKKNKSKLVCLTAYQKSIAKILDKYCDVILVGDSLGNVLYGMKNTHNISLEIMINHAKSVKLGVNKTPVVVDMPKNTYNNTGDALKNAKKILKISKCDAVKIESNNKNYKIIERLVKLNVPVMGHIGFTPQYKSKFKIQGLSKIEEKKLINEALNIEKAGAFAIVLECVALKTAKKITKILKIPTIGIGSSVNCDGQILVTDDMIGLSGFYPKFVKKYQNLNKIIEKGVQKYRSDVLKSLFPKVKNSY
jgi:3-methyl-2-oxobutanoate hydroxymethyltransferase